MLRGRKLLLADDSLTIQKVVSLTFADEGVEVSTADDGAQALRQLEQGQPDIVLADVHMPGPGGYELCRRIKADARWQHLPVLLLVGTFEPFNEAEARKAGADDVVTKPFQSIRDLVNKVGNLLGNSPADEPTAEDSDALVTRRTDADSAAPARDATEVAAPLNVVWEDVDAAATGDKQPSPAAAFADLDADDATIHSVSAEQFQTQHQLHANAAARIEAAEFETDLSPRHFAADDRREKTPMHAAAPTVGADAFDLNDDHQRMPAEPRHEPQGAHLYAAAAASAGHAAADDALLDLGESEPAQNNDDADTDDIILDMGDDDRPAAVKLFAEEAAPVALPYDDHLLSLTRDDAPGATLMMGAAKQAASPDDVVFTASDDAPASGVATSAATDASFSAAEAWTTDAPATSPLTHEQAANEVRPGDEAFASSSAAPAQLSPEMVDAVARRVVELMSDAVVREIAWDVVPDLAERLVNRRLDEEKARAQQQ